MCIPRARPRSLWLGITGAAIFAVTVLFAWPKTPDEFEFLREFNPHIGPPILTVVGGSKAEWHREFQFESLSPELLNALGISSNREKWEEGIRFVYIDKGKLWGWLNTETNTLVLSNVEPPGWLEQNWVAVKKRLGMGTAAER